MKEILLMEENKERVYKHGEMEQNMMEIG